jgi:collagen triple helix repeat protein
MFSIIRRRLCYANVVATLALVFAMSGGALAASHYLLTSTSQISPKVLKALRGKAGAQGAPGVAGSQGPAGFAGAQGAKGEGGQAGPAGPAGQAGPTGETGAGGAPGATGKEGSPWTAGGTLPSKKSETGVWAIQVAPNLQGTRIPLASFSIPVTTAEAEALAFNVVGPEEGAGEPHEKLPAGCKGNRHHPEANPGNVCAFELFAVNIMELTEPIVTTAGVLVGVEQGNESEPFRAAGTWAVTAK